MRLNIREEIQINEGIDVEIKGRKVTIKKEEKKIEKEMPIKLKKQDDKIIIEIKKATKREKKLIGTTRAHIRNMLKGLEEDYFYKLQICSIHFPITVSVEDNKLVVKNFLGETKPRVVKLNKNVQVKIDKDIITVQSFDKELAGQTAANIEKAGKIKARDRRIFQDGIYITEKPGGKI